MPEATWAAQKKLVVDGFDYTLAGDTGVSSNYEIHSPMSGFDIYGLDRKKLEGGVLGIIFWPTIKRIWL